MSPSTSGTSSSNASVKKLPRCWRKVRYRLEPVKRAFLLALACAAAAMAVAAAQDQLPVPTFRAEANYVRVDVFPTKDGVPVLDLKAEDFEVVEDRTAQKIEQFEHVVIRTAGGGEGRPEPNTVAESL